MSKSTSLFELFEYCKITSKHMSCWIFILLSGVSNTYANPGSLADIVEESSKAVVQIQTKRESYQSGIPPYDAFNQKKRHRGYSPHFGQEHSPNRRAPGMGIGSGFLISADGLIVTNAHVIAGADTISVKFSNSQTKKAKLIGLDKSSDLAVLKVEGSNLPHIEFGDSNAIRIGDSILAIGSPFGLTGTATSGIISAKGRDLKMGRYDNFLQIDAPINSGNSGGPVLNMDGKVIAVSTAIYSPTGGNIGIGFAIPSNDANRIIEDLRTFKYVKRGYLGINMQALNQDLTKALKLKNSNGVLITQVQDKTPAQLAGLKAGDVVTAFDEQSISTPDDLSRLVAKSKPGVAYKLELVRNSIDKTLLVTLEEQARLGEQEGTRISRNMADGDLGIELSEITPALRNRLRINEEQSGVLVSKVRVEGAADKAGLEPGDIIVQINNQPAKDPNQCINLLRDEIVAEYALLLIRRGERNIFVGFKNNTG